MHLPSVQEDLEHPSLIRDLQKELNGVSSKSPMVPATVQVRGAVRSWDVLLSGHPLPRPSPPPRGCTAELVIGGCQEKMLVQFGGPSVFQREYGNSDF